MKTLRVRAIVFALAAAFFGYVFYTRYWIWRDCIAASQSSCVTPDGST